MTNKHTRNGNNIILREGDNTVVDNNAVCEIFNDYFANIASSIGFEDEIECIDSAIKKHNSHSSVMKIKASMDELKTFNFRSVCPEEINQKLKSIDIKKATGCDNIPGKILRLAHNELSIPLTSLINNCMKSNVFPDIMKLADVSPNYKKSDNLVKGNYRPVSVLTTLSKLYESAMNDQLLCYFASIFNDLLNAFRKGRSCQTLLVKCIEDWKSALDENKYVGVLFTCHRVQRKIMFRKLYFMHIYEKISTCYYSFSGQFPQTWYWIRATSETIYTRGRESMQIL